MANWTQQLREAYYKLKESRAVSDSELMTVRPGGAGGAAGAARNVGRIEKVITGINQRAQQPGWSENAEKLVFDSKRASSMLQSFGVNAVPRRGGMGVKQIEGKDGIAIGGGLTNLRVGELPMSSRVSGAHDANTYMRQRRAQLPKE